MSNPDGTQTEAEKAEEEVRKASRAVDEARVKERWADATAVGAVGVAGGTAVASTAAGAATLGLAAPVGGVAVGAAVTGAATAAGLDHQARVSTDTAIQNAEKAEERLNAIREAQGLEPVDVDYEAQARPYETAIGDGYDYVAEGAEAGYDYLASGEAYNDAAQGLSDGYDYVAEGAEGLYDTAAQGLSDAGDAIAETWDSLDLNPFDDE
ncbi:MAG: hypothetical protein ACRD0U_00195 [Acidimicrobiales bacterium]